MTTDLKTRAVKGSAWSFAQAAGGEGISLVVFVLLARMLAPEDVGLVALAGVVVMFLGVFVSQGFVQTLVQRKELSEGHLDTAFWTGLGFAALLALGAFLGADAVAALYGQAQLAEVVRWLAVTLVFGGLSAVHEAVIQRRLGFKQLALRRIAAGIAGGVVGVGMALNGFGLWSLVGKQLAEQAVATAVLWGASGWLPGRQASRRCLAELMGFEANALGIRLINFVTLRVDVALIGFFLGPGPLGFYAVAQRLLTTLQQFLVVPVNQVALPVLSRLQDDPARLREAFTQATRLASWVVFPAFIGMAAVAPDAVALAFGEAWLPSADVLRILCLMGILYGVLQFDGYVMMALGRPGLFLRLRLANAAANVLAVVIGVRWGLEGVATAFVVRAFVMAPLPLWVLRGLAGLDVSQFLRQFAAPLAVVGLMYAGLVVLADALAGMAPHWRLALMLPIGGLFMLLSMRAWAPEEYRRGQSLLKLTLSRGAKGAQV